MMNKIAKSIGGIHSVRCSAVFVRAGCARAGNRGSDIQSEVRGLPWSGRHRKHGGGEGHEGS